jgi:hypothetical protein
VAPNRVAAETVCLVDFLATFAAITSYHLPDNAGEDSYSWLPLLLGRTLSGPLREATVHHANNGLFAIRRGPWKLTPDDMGSGGFTQPVTQAGAGTLYNLASDPSEVNNQYANRPNDVNQLRALLTRYRTENRSTPLPRSDEFWTPVVPVKPVGKHLIGMWGIHESATAIRIFGIDGKLHKKIRRPGGLQSVDLAGLPFGICFVQYVGFNGVLLRTETLLASGRGI